MSHPLRGCQDLLELRIVELRESALRDATVDVFVPGCERKLVLYSQSALQPHRPPEAKCYFTILYFVQTARITNFLPTFTRRFTDLMHTLVWTTTTGLGAAVGGAVGAAVGGAVGAIVVATVGAAVGATVGAAVGATVVGAAVVVVVGATVPKRATRFATVPTAHMFPSGPATIPLRPKALGAK